MFLKIPPSLTVFVISLTLKMLKLTTVQGGLETEVFCFIIHKILKMLLHNDSLNIVSFVIPKLQTKAMEVKLIQLIFCPSRENINALHNYISLFP